MSMLVSYMADMQDYLIQFDTPGDFDKAEDLRKDFLDICDDEISEGEEDRYTMGALMEYWTLHGIICSEVVIDYEIDMYES